MKNNVAVVIPYYHSELTELESISFRNCCTILKKISDYTSFTGKKYQEESTQQKRICYMNRCLMNGWKVWILIIK